MNPNVQMMETLRVTLKDRYAVPSALAHTGGGVFVLAVPCSDSSVMWATWDGDEWLIGHYRTDADGEVLVEDSLDDGPGYGWVANGAFAISNVHDAAQLIEVRHRILRFRAMTKGADG